MSLGAGDYLVTVLALAAALVPLALGASRLRARLVPEYDGPVALLAASVLFLSLLVITTELLGAIGLFKPLPVVTGCMTVGLGVWAGAGPRIGVLGGGGERQLADDEHRSPRRGPALAVTIAIAAAALVFAEWGARTQAGLDRGMVADDTLWYHMPFAARFVQDASIVHLHFTDPRLLTWFYPQNSELLHGFGILLFGTRDFLSPLLNLGWLALAFLAAWCAGRPFDRAPHALLAVAVLMGANVMVTQPGEALNDVPALAALLASAALLLQGAGGGARGHGEEQAMVANQGADRPTESPGPAPGALLIAALAGGLAVGTKLTVAPAVAGLTVALIVLAPPGSRGRTAVIWFAGLVATGGFWYARNLIAVGNPLPFWDLGPLPSPGVELQQPSYAIWHYATDPEIWSQYFFSGLHERLGELWPGLLLMAGAGAIAALARPRSAAARAIGIATLVAAAAYLVTPLGAQGPPGMPVGFIVNVRYLAPALLLGLVLVAIATLPRISARGVYIAPWLLLAALSILLLLGSRPTDYLSDARVAGSALAAGALLVAVALAARQARERWRVPAIALATAGLIGLLAAGYPAQRDYIRDRYVDALERLDLDGAYAEARGLTDSRIALAGTTAALRQYGFYGSELSNRVQYIGRRIPHDGYRAPVSCEDWKREVNRGRYRLLVTSPFFARVPRESVEMAWARTDPAAVPVLRQGEVTVYRLAGRLDPDRCRKPAPVRVSPQGAVL